MYLSATQLKNILDLLPDKKEVYAGEVAEIYRFPISNLYFLIEDIPRLEPHSVESFYLNFRFDHRCGEWIFVSQSQGLIIMYTYINLKNEAHVITHVEVEFLKTLESSGSVEVDHKNKIIRCIKPKL